MNLRTRNSEPLVFPPAARLSRLPAYVFVRLDELKDEARRCGVDLIDLGLGNPDGATPQPVLKALDLALKDTSTHGYPPFAGRADFKEAVADFIFKRYQASLDPNSEVLPLVGSKEGLAHLAFAYIDEGDLALVPNPCYPVHLRGALLAGGAVYELPLTEENDYLPQLELIPREVASKAKLLILNYPNNPTTATAPDWLLERAVAFCRKNNVLLVHDLAYGELYFGSKRPRSLLEIEGGKDVGVEFHTLSKTFNMAGWRIGFAVGNAHVIKTLYALKTNIDYGVFGAVQMAGIAALTSKDEELEQLRLSYRRRSEVVVKALTEMGWHVRPPQATMYVWARIPAELNMPSSSFAEGLVGSTGVVVTPGVAFGSLGEGYVRISLVAPEERLQEAMRRWYATDMH